MHSLQWFLTFGSLLASHVHAAAVNPLQSKRAEVCSTLVSKYRNQTLLPSDTEYPAQREAHWSQTAYKSPDCIFFPRNSDDVVQTVKLLRKSTEKFAVRSGGHSPLPQWANVDNGVLISMRDMTDLSYDSKQKQVRAGSGNRWGKIYEYLQPYNQLVVGGRSPTVGFGLLGGGGLSHLSNEYGFSSSNVVKFEVVLADGSKKTASEKSEPDLFWALKGGGNNFGIITHVTFKTVPMGKVWGGTIIYSGDKRDELMAAYAEYQAVGQLDQKSALLSYLAINNDTMFVNLAYTADVARPAAFAPFYNITPLVDTTQSYDNFLALVSGGIELNVPRWTWGSTVLYLDKNAYIEVGKICQKATAKLAGINGGTMVLMPQPISKSMVAKSAARGGSSPLNVRNREQLWFAINMGWNFASDDAKVGTVLMETIGEIEAYTKSKKLHDAFVFLNDAYFTQQPFEGAVKSRLQSIAKRYDSQEFFQTHQPGGFKLT